MVWEILLTQHTLVLDTYLRILDRHAQILQVIKNSFLKKGFAEGNHIAI